MMSELLVVQRIHKSRTSLQRPEYDDRDVELFVITGQHRSLQRHAVKRARFAPTFITADDMRPVGIPSVVE
jgi:putative ribosome biogenesis GTPase RsgA